MVRRCLRSMTATACPCGAVDHAAKNWRAVGCGALRLFVTPQLIERASDTRRTPVQDVGVDHGARYVGVAQQSVDYPDVVAGPQEVSGTRLGLAGAAGAGAWVAGDGLCQPDLRRCREGDRSRRSPSSVRAFWLSLTRLSF